MVPRHRSRIPALTSLAIALSAAVSAVGALQAPEPAFNRIIFAGDVMFCRAVRRQILAARDPALPFRKIAPLMAASDIAFVNLESPFSDRGPYLDTGLIFHAPPDTIAGLRLAGVSVASTANNHSRDCGDHGVTFTVDWLRSHGIEPLGSSESEARTHEGVVLTRHGVRFGFLGYTFDQQNGNWHDIDKRIALTDIGALCRDVTALRKHADVVIVSMHNGVEYRTRPSGSQTAFARAAIDAGATLVIGHHPHVVQQWERYNGGLIFYSLGNFIFDQYQREATQHGEVVQASFLGAHVLAVHVMRVRITPTGPELESFSLMKPPEMQAIRSFDCFR
ncbi:MAG: CapA family protein [Acidobacteriaceae bacterium]|nr:CapA family protein [Acidobacteriaceae bacterium]